MFTDLVEMSDDYVDKHDKLFTLRKEKKTVKRSGRICIVHYERHYGDTDIRPLSVRAFDRIQAAVKERSQHSNARYRLDEMCWRVPELYDAERHGVHRWCYNNFVNVRKNGRMSKTAVAKAETASTSECCSTDSDDSVETPVLFSSQLCIFCDRDRRQIKGKTVDLVKCAHQSAAETIKQCAKGKCDLGLLNKIADIDLVAQEAHYHEACRRSYTRPDDRLNRKPSLHRPEDGPNLFGGTEQRSAYKHAFQHICKYITDHVINGGNVVRMTMIRERYLQFIQEHYPMFYDPDHKAGKLKERIIRHFGFDVKFWQPSFNNDLLYSARPARATAVAFESATSETQLLTDAAMILRRHVVNSLNTASEMPALPSAEYLQQPGVSAPSCLTDFIAIVIAGESDSKLSDLNCLYSASSMAADICAAAKRDQ